MAWTRGTRRRMEFAQTLSESAQHRRLPYTAPPLQYLISAGIRIAPTMKKELRVLVVEDTAPDVVLINHELRRAGLHCRSKRVDSREQFMHELQHHRPDVILSDHGVPGFDGFAALAEARHCCPEVPFIFVSGSNTEEAIVKTLQCGADDYVPKSRLNLLPLAIQRALRESELRARQHQAETARYQAEECLRHFTAEAKDYAMLTLNTEGRVASWSEGAERMLGCGREEILDASFGELLPSGTRERHRLQHLLEGAAEQERVEEVGWFSRKNGEEFRARCVVIALRTRARDLRGFLCVLQESSERDKTQTAGKKPEAKEPGKTPDTGPARELEEFTHSIALDLRTPLRHVESMVETLIRGAGEKLDHKSRSYLRTISDATGQLSRLIDDLFTFSRIGQTELYKLEFSLADVAREVVHDLRREAGERHVEWVFGELPTATGDPVMLALVFHNLISNALKFTRPRRHPRIEIGSMSSDREITVFVRDNGVGFDPVFTDKLFGVFQRLHGGSEFEGTGVGLANVRRVIERHGGRTWAEGALDEGATFYFTLPRA